MNLNGQEFESCYLTPKEKAVVDAMRAGARLYISKNIGDSPKALNLAYDFLEYFSKVDGLQESRIDDLSHCNSPSVAFGKRFVRLEVTAYISAGKRVFK